MVIDRDPQSKYPPSFNRMRGRGFTLVEVLLVLGVIFVVLSLMLPAVSGVRRAGASINAASNIRQMAMGVSFYAANNRDLPPVMGEARWPTSARWQFDFGEVGEGNWFEHSWLYAYAITAELGDVAVANAPGKGAKMNRVYMHRGERVSLSDYHLTHTLYARPAFFRWETRAGLAQFGAQPLSSMLFPSDKGIMHQPTLYHYPEYGTVVACCLVDLASPVAFGDLSVSEHVLRRLPPGIFNNYAPNGVPPETDPRTITGAPVADTVDGVRGRDR